VRACACQVCQAPVLCVVDREPPDRYSLRKLPHLQDVRFVAIVMITLRSVTAVMMITLCTIHSCLCSIPIRQQLLCAILHRVCQAQYGADRLAARVCRRSTRNTRLPARAVRADLLSLSHTNTPTHQHTHFPHPDTHIHTPRSPSLSLPLILLPLHSPDVLTCLVSGEHTSRVSSRRGYLRVTFKRSCCRGSCCG
jgi:hypothetical protein